MIACGNCAQPTIADGVVWRCVPCQRAGKDTVMCSPACFYEHVADHDQVERPPRYLELWEAQPELEPGGGQ